MTDDSNNQEPGSGYAPRRTPRGNPVGWVLALGFIGLAAWVVFAYG